MSFIKGRTFLIIDYLSN